MKTHPTSLLRHPAPGAATYESEPHEGTALEAASAELAASRHIIPAQPRLLIAGDDADLRGRCAAALRDEGCEVELARDGEAALLKLAFTYFDLLITEWKMDRLDGASLLHWLRASGQTLPVVMVTAGAPHELPAATQRQLYALLPKPASPGRVVGVVRKALDLPIAPSAATLPNGFALRVAS